jgi:hypothetical protein
MHKKLKLRNVLIEDNSGGGAVHAQGADLASFLTAGGTIDWKNIIPDQAFGKYKSSKMGKTNVANNADGGLAHMLAMGMFSVAEVEESLANMGVRVSDLRDQDTIDFYKALKEFDLIISLNKGIKGFFNDEKDNIQGKASVDKRSNAKKFVIYFTYGDFVYRINFSPKTLQKNLKGTEFDLPMLIKNEIYDVKISIQKDLTEQKSKLNINNILETIITERTPPKGSQVGKGEYWDDKSPKSKYYDRKIKINKIPTFVEETKLMTSKDDVDPIFVGGIDITDNGGNSTWSLGNAESKLNGLLRGGVKIRPSKKDKDSWLVVYWSKQQDFGDSKATEAMLISPINSDVKSFLQKVTSSGVVDEEIEIGKKVAGSEDITNPAKGKITLRPKF